MGYISSQFLDRLVPHAATIQAYLKHSTLKERKALILIARSRRNPYHDRLSETVLWRLTQSLWKSLKSMPLFWKPMLVALDWFVVSAMRSGLLLSLLISFPPMPEEVEQIKDAMIAKEMSAMERSRRKSTIHWSLIMEGSRTYQVARNQHPNVSSQTRQNIMIWSRRQSERVLYPHSGRKLLSISSMQHLWGSTNSNLASFSSMDAERIYGLTGERPESSCEMKMRWYATQPVPRVYFAQGLTAYHSSKYLRNAFNDLADLFRNVNRFERTMPQLVLSESVDDELFVYDLTSFTSLFHEHREFLLSLAEMVDHVEVRYADSWFGLCHTTLGYLIRDYVTNNVTDPSYCSMLLPFDQSLELSHGTAGFLGVYGNLITCTIPHGIILGTFNDNLRSCWCAGDDAGICAECHRKRELFQLLRRLGTIAEEKTFIGSEPGSVALKRPVRFENNLVVFQSSVIWPVFGLLYGSEIYSKEDRDNAVDKFASALTSFLQSARKVDLSSDDQDLAVRICSFLYRALGLPTTGWYPPCTGYFPHRTTIPVMDPDAFRSDPLSRLVSLFCRNEYTCVAKERKSIDKDDLVLQGSSEGNMTEWTRWLCSLGYINAEKVMVTLYGAEALERALDDTRPVRLRIYDEPALYVFNVLSTIPKSHICIS